VSPLYFVSADSGLLAHWQRVAPAGLPSRLETLADLAPGIVLLDDEAAADLAALPLARHRVVLASLNPDDAQGFAALSAGCAGYCHALASIDQLQQVLDVVAAGEIWAGRALVLRMIAAMQRLPSASSAPDLSMLSLREREVAQLAAKGLANKEIARQLDIAERTVKAHLSATFAKLGVNDRVHLVLRLKGLD
jgi:DNA-binding NarL/FixJ family response regulator